MVSKVLFDWPPVKRLLSFIGARTLLVFVDLLASVCDFISAGDLAGK